MFWVALSCYAEISTNIQMYFNWHMMKSVLLRPQQSLQEGLRTKHQGWHFQNKDALLHTESADVCCNSPKHQCRQPHSNTWMDGAAYHQGFQKTHSTLAFRPPKTMLQDEGRKHGSNKRKTELKLKRRLTNVVAHLDMRRYWTHTWHQHFTPHCYYVFSYMYDCEHLEKLQQFW